VAAVVPLEDLETLERMEDRMDLDEVRKRLNDPTIPLLWALADEEKLAWHDHMSKTFPTIEESNRSFFRKRR
jgi:hypothetical protein